MMKVSVIVPVFNKEQYISECIESLIGQTFPDIEIILVDDESTDRSGIICDEYAKKDERVHVIHADGEGPASACRTGMEIAGGDYVCFVDSDDWVDTDMVERLAAHITGRGDEIVLSDYVIERSDGSHSFVYQDIEPGEYLRSDIVDKVMPRLWGLEDRAVSQSRCMKLYSADLARKNIHYPDPDLKFAEDSAFLLPCVLDAGRMFFMDKAAMYHYRYVSDSAVHRYSPNMTSDIERVRGIVERAIDEKFDKDPGLRDRLRELYRSESVIMLLFAMKNELKGDRSVYRTKIRQLCTDPENARIIREHPVQMKHPYNRLVYHTMKHPSSINCRLLRLIMDIHER